MSTTRSDLPRAITLRLPMGGLIASGTKTVENRKRRLPGVKEGDWIFIHQTSTVFGGSWKKLKDWNRETKYLGDGEDWLTKSAWALSPDTYATGIIGIARVDAILTPEDIETQPELLEPQHRRWYIPGNIAYVLGSVRCLDEPVAHKGQLGAWFVRDVRLRELRDQVAQTEEIDV